MITALQLKLGRVAAGLGVRDLARISGVGAATITRIENGRPGNKSTFYVLEDVLQERGVVFVPADEKIGAGVRIAWDRDPAGSVREFP